MLAVFTMLRSNVKHYLNTGAIVSVISSMGTDSYIYSYEVKSNRNWTGGIKSKL